MIIRQCDFTKTVGKLLLTGERSMDTETTGLMPYHDSQLFSIIIADQEKAYYFNFQLYPDLAPEWVLPREWIEQLKPVFSNPDSMWYMSNAKFDMAMLAREGVRVAGKVHCTEALGRVERNDEFQYGLDASAKRIGLEKSDTVEQYIKKHKLVENGNKLFYKVPFNIIVPYGEQDAKVTLALGQHQRKVFDEIDNGTPEGLPKITQIVENEKRFTKTCFKIEQIGIKIDTEYCRKAILYETDRYRSAESRFQELTGLPFKDSNAVLKKAFEETGEEITLTEKGNPSFTKDVLKKYTTPVASVVKELRDAHKNIATYYENFLIYQKDGVIHPKIRQSGTKHGRISIVDPALQTLPRVDEDYVLGAYEVRRAFVPRPGTFFIMMDYDQMEYRMMFDYARQMDFIREVIGGLDVHDATVKIIKDMLGIAITRGQAKTLNFGLLYGMGVDALAEALKVEREKSRMLKSSYFQALPQIKMFIRRVTQKAEANGYIFNWAGRRCYYKDLNFSYTAPNHLISGGCADVVKIAMNQIDELLEDKKTKMVMQVHDEILFEMVPEEKWLIPILKDLMEGAYPYKHLKLTVSVEHSYQSWADKVKGIPA